MDSTRYVDSKNIKNFILEAVLMSRVLKIGFSSNRSIKQGVNGPDATKSLVNHILSSIQYLCHKILSWDNKIRIQNCILTLGVDYVKHFSDRKG